MTHGRMRLLPLRLARRDLRAGTRGLRIVLACLALGVAAIAGVGSLRAGIDASLAREGRRILGGDLEILGGSQPLPDALRGWLAARGARLSDVVTMRAMVVAPSGERALVELKAVDPAWPLVGAPTLAPRQTLATLPGGLLVDPALPARLHVAVGETARLGRASLAVRGSLADEPDRVADPSIFGPRVLMALADLPATSLVAPGSIVEHRLRAALPPGADVAGTVEALRAAFPGTGWQIRTAHDAAPGVTRFIDQTSLFLTLVGLASLLVGGIGVAGGVAAWLRARARGIATLRALGAVPALVFQVCLIEVMALASLGVLVGLALGAALPALVVAVAGGLLPVTPALGPFVRPLLLAAACGLLVAAAFALPSLGRAMRVGGAALFRDAVLPDDARPGPRLLGATALLGAALIGLVVGTAAERPFAAGFCAAALLTLGLFRTGGALLVRGAARLPRPGRFALRLGLAGLHRPGGGTPGLLVAIGLGLSTLAGVALIEGNLRRQVAEQLPRNAPSFFFIDLQPDQLDPFRAILAGFPDVTDIRTVPSLRARLVAVRGVPVEQVRATPETAWALRGDRGLTYAAAMPAGTRLVAGAWWPPDYAGPPLVSFDANLARGWGVGVGDTLTVNVLGRTLDLRIASLRDVNWRAMGLNFTLVASPGLLAGAPHTEIATARAPAAIEPAVLRAVTDALPNVSAIRIADVLDAIARILGQLGGALAASGGFTLGVGALVLAGAVAGGRERRVREAVILKTLGATRAQVRTAWLVEFGILGTVAGVLAAVVGTLASLAVMRLVLHAPWAFLPGRLALTVAGCIALMLALGFAATEAALRAPAAPSLRDE